VAIRPEPRLHLPGWGVHWPGAGGGHRPGPPAASSARSGAVISATVRNAGRRGGCAAVSCDPHRQRSRADHSRGDQLFLTLGPPCLLRASSEPPIDLWRGTSAAEPSASVGASIERSTRGKRWTHRWQAPLPRWARLAPPHGQACSGEGPSLGPLREDDPASPRAVSLAAITEPVSDGGRKPMWRPAWRAACSGASD
jgi:hypothetical protein